MNPKIVAQRFDTSTAGPIFIVMANCLRDDDTWGPVEVIRPFRDRLQCLAFADWMAAGFWFPARVVDRTQQGLARNSEL
jgi:hypothetical protein